MICGRERWFTRATIRSREVSFIYSSHRAGWSNPSFRAGLTLAILYWNVMSRWFHTRTHTHTHHTLERPLSHQSSFFSKFVSSLFFSLLDCGISLVSSCVRWLRNVCPIREKKRKWPAWNWARNSVNTIDCIFKRWKPGIRFNSNLTPVLVMKLVWWIWIWLL